MPWAIQQHKPRTWAPATPSTRKPDTRVSPCKRGYDANWVKFRRQYLRRHPVCVECLRFGDVTPATVIDHIVPMARGGAKYDPDNLQALCASCHGRKTAQEDGGFGNTRVGNG